MDAASLRSAGRRALIAVGIASAVALFFIWANDARPRLACAYSYILFGVLFAASGSSSIPGRTPYERLSEGVGRGGRPWFAVFVPIGVALAGVGFTLEATQ